MMKKPLIALLALAGVAAANTEFESWDLRVYTSQNGTLSDTLGTGNQDFYYSESKVLTSYTFNFNATVLNEYHPGGATYSFTLFNTSRTFSPNGSGGTDKNGRGGLGIYSSVGSADNKVTVGFSIGTGMITGSPTLDINEGDSVSFAYDAVSKTALLYNETTKTLIETVLEEDDETYYFESGSSDKTEGASAVFTQGGAHQLTFGNITNLEPIAGDVSAIKSYIGVVPEPSTATLSLLALAGLAARRRRR